MSFYDEPLRILGQLAKEPVGTVEDLCRLKEQLDQVLNMVDQEQLVPMTEEEQREHANRYGSGAFLVGDFVIRRR